MFNECVLQISNKARTGSGLWFAEAVATDNGAETITYPDGGTTPFKGGKLSTWEGGMRALPKDKATYLRRHS